MTVIREHVHEVADEADIVIPLQTPAALVASIAAADFSDLPTTDPEAAGVLWVDAAADFVVKVSQG